MKLVIYLLAINFVTFAAYWLDKRASRERGARRVPEATLLGLGFIGGTVAAIAAQQMLRHKTKKTSFRIKFWLITLLQIALVLFPPHSVHVLFARFFA